MRNGCEKFQPLMSGRLDNELSEEDRRLFDEHIAQCAACRDEFAVMRRLVEAVSTLWGDLPPEEVWDTFLDGVHNRVERQTGWVVFIIGAAALALYGIYVFIVDPWGPALLKVLFATPVVGLGIVFVSVLRQRLAAAKTDRYSKEIMR